ncbi:MAG: hypothetical protein KDA52_15460 [Planctomycetaceae bacterium]|nr:hypothetical protein [Planctomycetaceae bacterium]
MDLTEQFGITIRSDGEGLEIVCRRNFVARPLFLLWGIPTITFLLISLYSWVVDGFWSIGTLIAPVWGPGLLYIFWRLFGRIRIQCRREAISFQRSLLGIVIRRRTVRLADVEMLLVEKDDDNATPTTYGLYLFGPISYALLREQRIERCEWLGSQIASHYALTCEIEIEE